MFDKSDDLFPSKRECTFLSHCSVSPLYSGGLRREIELATLQSRGGPIFDHYLPVLSALRRALAALMKTQPDDIAFVKNTSEGMNLIAGGYPFQRGDQVITYVHEYPATYYPWKLQASRGVEVLELPNTDAGGITPEGQPGGFSLDALERMITKRTRVVALSQVQFTSGFGLDVERAAALCRANGIDLVIDAAQALGSLPVYPEAQGIAAVMASGWKWLMGPLGTGILYVSPALRSKLETVMAGAELMQQGLDFLNHDWAPVATSKRFEYSTSSLSLAAALECAVREVQLRYGIEAIRDEIFRLQDVFLQSLDRTRFRAMVFAPEHRSGIVAVTGPVKATALSKALGQQNIAVTAQGGYLRVAPHFYNTEDQVERCARALNALVRS